ncbi:hypothetical protein V8E51_004084 [Hyaloscypha variabilis]|uniref:Uncharacterized protein n=1 Tax=Hyaloscypha variabilis (strain UAMH 11265 / GT02V1 / F) TaxID=1149755 RepID=A0A2J6R756_HYAVF|nr:hypothetical protein L207DRAFT_638860 [Hyaloscypha variabilis F]
MYPTWFKESAGELQLPVFRIQLHDSMHSPRHQDEGPILVKYDGLLLDSTPEARKSKYTLLRSGNRGGDNENAVAKPRRNNSSINFDSVAEEFNTCIPLSTIDKHTEALPRLDSTQKIFLKNENIQKKIWDIQREILDIQEKILDIQKQTWDIQKKMWEEYNLRIHKTSRHSVAAANLSWTPCQMVNIEPGGKQPKQSKSVAGFKNQGSKRREKANKAIDPDSNYFDQSISWLSTANGKINDNSYLATYAIHHVTWSLEPWPGPTYHFTEPHEDKIACDEAAISYEAESLSDPYGQIIKGHLTTVEEGTLESYIRVEDERSHDARPYSHVRCFKLCSRFDPDDENSFIQASCNALLPNEALSTPLLEVPPSRKKYVFVWQCCACGTSRINIMVNNCPECSEPRCGYCKTEKVQVR